MEEYSTIVSGFGGQGVILTGKIIARSGMEEGLEVTWLPSYGPEMRGGTANCTAIISSKLIGSPVVNNPSSLIAFNEPSLDKFGASVREGGVIVLNSSLIEDHPEYGPTRVVPVSFNEIARQLENQKVINMVALGAWSHATEALSLEALQKGMKLTLEESGKGKFVEVNEKALEKGYAAAD
ncbi:2-oxoacid:acceptor oxidoreductase family protein [Candidatus Bipolaricaulota bacterium]|nr:2-oxoacid:acceptor oxidoreductase family protein [Candidatus Bipolaricaulota bacterium]